MSSFSSADVAAADQHVDALVASNQATEALLSTLVAPPIGIKDAEVKHAYRAVVYKAIAAIDDRDIAAAVEALDGNAANVLLKYIYSALSFAHPPTPEGSDATSAAVATAEQEQKKRSASLLKWHALVAAKTGPGSVIRVMTDRKRV